MTREEILNFLKEHNGFRKEKLSPGITTLLRNKHKDVIEEMRKVTGIEDDNVSRLIWHLVNGNEIPKCPVCGKPLEFKNYGEGYKSGCSKECQNYARGKSNRGRHLSEETKAKMKQTSIERYGYDNPSKSPEVQAKIEKTNERVYGYNRPSKSPIVKEKIKQTNRKKYNTDAPLQNPDVLNKMLQANEEKWGNKCTLQNPEVRAKADQTNLERYGNIHPSKNKEVAAKAGINRSKEFYRKLFTSNRIPNLVPLFNIEEYEGSKKEYLFKCTICGTEFTDGLKNGSIPRCPKCFPRISSKWEDEVCDFVEKLGFKIVKNDRKILNGKELDIYIPEKNLAIECNGLHYHSDKYKDKNYHLEKSKACEEKGIRLIQFFSDEWFNNRAIVKSMIKSALGIYERKIGARECEVRKIKDCSDFLNENHLQGNIPSLIKLGLFYKDELVSVLTLSEPRYNSDYNWEILRFTTLKNTQVVGGLSKLLSYFRRNFEGSIITYSDRRLFTGNAYRKIFKELEPSTPNYFYFKDDYRREGRQKYQKHNLIKLHPELSEFSEREIMSILGYDRIYDCGNWRFILE